MNNLPRHIRERIEEAKIRQLRELDLSWEWGMPETYRLEEVPAEVFEFEQLEVLNLSTNLFHDIPNSIARLRNLVSLDLSWNKLEALPQGISQLRGLMNLQLSGNPLKALPEWMSALENLTSLGLYGIQLTSLAEWISRFRNLEDLSVGYNRFAAPPDSISHLNKLRSLSLANIGLRTVPEWISQLRKLESLDLDGNGLTEIPKWISELPNLSLLHLGHNPLARIPEWIPTMENLSDLGLAAVGLTAIPEWLPRLTKLAHLDLNSNKVVTFPVWFSTLLSLITINLAGNGLSVIPEGIFELEHLSTLWLAINGICEVPDSIGKLQNLERLSLVSNQLESMPEAISQLHKLQVLLLSDNKLKSLPKSISQLEQLREIDLADNLFDHIPDAIYKLSSLTKFSINNDPYIQKENRNTVKAISHEILALPGLIVFDVDNTGIETPPPEVASKDVEAIRNYFRQLEAEGKDYLYEAKLLVVGEPGAGKTTLVRKLQRAEYTLRDDEKSTEGIDVVRWRFVMENGREFQVNIWDFGGQEIYQATHQFFLTRRSLYLLVADTRREDTDFYYWLNVVEVLSDSSPLLIIKNEKQDRHREINESQLRAQYSNLKESLVTNLATNRGLSLIVAEIKRYIAHLPQVGAALPKTWVDVRKAIENDPRNHISLEEYLHICQTNNIKQYGDQIQLIEYLHDLGVCLHFQADPLLKKTVILKPRWGTDAVYKVLDSKQVIHNLGRFTRDDIVHIWDDYRYADMQDELLQLMINFKLCYKIPELADTYIAPQLLTENQPTYGWDKTENLILRYSYPEFTPKGILTQFIVAMHRYIIDQKNVWKTGVLLEKEQTWAEVIECYGKREIRIRISGKHKKDLMTIVTYELDKIHSSYRRLSYNKLIPCNCPVCKELMDPCFYSLETLRKFVEDRQPSIQCQKSYQMVGVVGLIDDVIERQALAYAKESGRGANIFQGPIETVVIEPKGDSVMVKKLRSEIVARSAWANGLFYLFCFAVVLGGLGVLARAVPSYALAIILIAGILFIPLIGTLQLRQDNRLSEKSFTELIKIIIKQLPLIAGIGKHDRKGGK